MTREEIIARFRKDAADELISDEYRVLLTHAADMLEGLKVAEDALEFYAERTNWKRGDRDAEWSNALIIQDCAMWNTGGGRARLALQKLKETR